MKNDRIIIFDTTLRDGEQCPGAAMTPREKLEVARQLARLGVDVIEAGFPVSSEGDFASVQQIAREVRGPVICGLARCVPKDIDAAGNAIKPAGKRGRIHVFLGTSKLHREFKLGKAQSEIIRLAIESVKRAKDFVDNVEFSPEDASRTELDFLVNVVEAAIDAGATTINMPDTTGYATPTEYERMFRHVIEHARGAKNVIFSAHCHDDLGLAVANALAAVQGGARQVEGTINGIGERAGNTALEEFVMALRTRQDIFQDLHTGLKVREIVKTSRLVSHMCSFPVPRNKAIVGANAFAHGSGIHQDGILKKRETYEIMDPREVGWGLTELPLTKHSGRAAVAARLKHLGFKMTDTDIAALFARFKEIGDKKKFVYDDDLTALVEGIITEVPETWSLDYLSVTSGNQMVPTATVRLKRPGREASNGQVLQDAGIGDGPVDAALKAIDRLTNTRGKLMDYSLRAVSQGKDALGEVSVKVDFGTGELITGKGASTDIIEASARAYLNAVNRFVCENNSSNGKPARRGKSRAVAVPQP
jgi:2-isopropylmalate synthase